MAQSSIRAERIVRTSCSLCPHQDGILVYVKDERVVGIKGDPEHPATKGHTCVKGLRAHELLYHPGRVLHPLIKKGNRWHPISWEEALDTVADRLQEVRQRYGPLAICGANCMPDVTEALALTLFVHSLGSPNTMSTDDLCAAPGRVADQATAGYSISTYRSVTDFRNSKCILLAGTNLTESHPLQWKDASHALAQGAKLIVVDPRHTEVARRADIWLQIRPGTDGALALGMLNIIISEKLYDQEFVKNWCVGFEKLAERAKEYPLDVVSQITGLRDVDMATAARMFAQSKPACLRANLGVMQHDNSTQAARAFAALASITGNIDIPGGHLMPNLPRGFAFGRRIIAEEYRLPREIEEKRLGAKQFPLWSGPDATLMGAAHNPTVLKAMITGDPYPVKAMFVINTNPVLSYPDTRKVLEALRKLEFMVVCTYTMSPTAEFADIILPRAHPLEHNEVAVNPYGHWLSALPKAIEPPEECWEDIKILAELSQKMRQKGYIERSFIPWSSMDEFVDYRLKNAGVSFEELKQKGPMVIPARYKKYEERGFRTPSGKIELYSSIFEKFGYDPLPNYRELAESRLSTPRLAEKYPLMLVTSRRLQHFLSHFSEFPWVRELTPYPELEIHPEAARQRGIGQSDLVWVETPKGRFKHRAKISEAVPCEIVNGCFGWWLPEEPPPERGCLETNVNAATSYDPPYDPVVGINSVQGVLCQVRKAEGTNRPSQQNDLARGPLLGHGC